MSTDSISSGSSGLVGVPFNVTGLASGLNTNEIISELMAVAREPEVHMTDEQTTLQAQKQALQTIQSSLQQLALSTSELASPTLFNTSQTVSSSDPAQVSATTTTGAGVGGYQVNVTQLADSAQRTFTFASPASEDTITIDGQPIVIAAGSTIQDLIASINSNPSATVYAAALNDETVVFSSRATGDTGSSFIQVSDPGGALTEQASLAREGQNAEYTINGIAGSSSSNTVTNAIAGVTLNLNALTITTGSVTIDVAAPAPSASTIASQVQSFVALYNSTISAIQTQLTTKSISKPQTSAELGTGTLFGDVQLSSLLDSMRQTIYNPISELPAGMSSLADIGVSTGAPSGGGVYSQTAVEGQLTIDSTTLEEAIKQNPSGVEQMLQQWSKSFQSLIDVEAEPGGTLEARINGDSAQSAYLGTQIETMNEMLTQHQEALQAQYAALEAALSLNESQSSWLTSQTAAIESNDKG